MPFITAEIYQLFMSKNIQHEKYPEFNSKLVSESAEQKILWLQSIIMAIRNIRSEMQIPPSKKISVLLQNGNTQDKELIQALEGEIKFLARLENIAWTDTAPNPAATECA